MRPDTVTTVTVGPNEGIIADVVHDSPELDNERPLEMYLENPIHTFFMDSNGDPIIPLREMPEQASFTLKCLDRTNSGSIHLSDLQKAIDALEREKTENRSLYRILAFFFMFSLLVAVAMGFTTWIIFEKAKDLKVDHSYLKSIRDDMVVKAASSDFKIVENKLVTRECEEEFCPAVKVSMGIVERSMDSTIPNEDLKTLESVSIEGDSGAVVFAKVMAFSRFAEVKSQHGTILVLFTNLGEVTLDGDELLVSEEASAAFDRAGISLGSARRALGGSEARVQGYFQMASLQESDGDGLRSAGLDRELWDSMRRQMQDLRHAQS